MCETASYDTYILSLSAIAVLTNGLFSKKEALQSGDSLRRLQRYTVLCLPVTSKKSTKHKHLKEQPIIEVTII